METIFHNATQANSSILPPPGLSIFNMIPMEVMRMFNLVVSLSWILVIIPGLWMNAINMRTFYRLGLENSLNTSFFFLAIVDFVTLILVTALMCTSLAIRLIEFGLRTYNFDLSGIIIYLTISAAACDHLTGLTTTFLAVQRALCVLKPLTFRGLMSRTKTNVFLVTISVLTISVTVLYGSGYRFKLAVVDPYTNRTMYVLFVTKYLEFVQLFVVSFSQISLFLLCQVLVFGSFFVLVFALRASSRFRQTAATTAEGKSQTSKSPKGMKERGAVVQVALVSGFFLLIHLPKFILSFVEWLEPEFDYRGRYQYIWSLCMTLRTTLEYYNTLVNFPIYYKYNKKFREMCFSGGQSIKGL